MKDHQDRIGQQIGEYRVLRLLGSGSFGTVYLVQQIHDSAYAALKLLQMQLSRREDFKDFLNEARTFRLRHPHIVSLLDFGLSRDGLPFLVMEYAAGGTLRDRYPRRTQLPLESISRYVTEIASALYYAHTHRVIHRDVKPENMLLRADGTILLSDFGIARILEYSTSGSVPTQAGTPAYMAPEQSQGRPCAASDQYALATVVYEWIAGQRPFHGAPLEVVVQHRLDSPPSLCALRQNVAKDIEQVIFRALAKQPEDRFATIEQFAQALQATIQQASMVTLQTPASPVSSASSPTPVQPTPVQPLTASPLSLTKPQLVALATHPLITQASVKEMPHPRLPLGQHSTHPGFATTIETVPLARSRIVSPWRTGLLIVLALLIISAGVLSSFIWLAPEEHPTINGVSATAQTHHTTARINTPTKVSTPAGSIIEFAIPTFHLPEKVTPVPQGPEGITAGPDGNLWFTEPDDNRIGHITTTGSITEFAIPTSWGIPSEITAGPDGNLWFTEYSTGKIGRITTTGSITEFAIPTSQSEPEGITAGPDGNLWFTEYSTGKIGRITITGSITEYTTPIYSRPEGITAGPDGNLWFTEVRASKIGRITTTGSITEFATRTFATRASESRPEKITAGPDGNLWFTDTGTSKIGRITTTGSITEFALIFGCRPQGIIASPNGNLWFTEYNTDKIGRITITGSITEYTTPIYSRPEGITAGPDGNLWFTELGAHKIGRITSGK